MKIFDLVVVMVIVGSLAFIGAFWAESETKPVCEVLDYPTDSRDLSLEITEASIPYDATECLDMY